MEGRSLCSFDLGAAVLAITSPELGETLLETWFDPKSFAPEQIMHFGFTCVALRLNALEEQGIRCANVTSRRVLATPGWLHETTVEFGSLFHFRTGEAARITHEHARDRKGVCETKSTQGARPLSVVLSRVMRNLADDLIAKTPPSVPIALIIPNTSENHELLIRLWGQTLDRIRHKASQPERYDWSKHV